MIIDNNKGCLTIGQLSFTTAEPLDFIRTSVAIKKRTGEVPFDIQPQALLQVG